MDIAALRKSYEQGELDEASCAADPMAQFQIWLDQALAAQVPEPNAMTLATVGANGRPATRVVLVKGLDERGLVWYTNYASRKGQELAHCPFGALQFHWVELERVVRIEGRVEKTSAEQSDAYFATRPLASRLSAVVSSQSSVVGSRAVLEAAMAQATSALGEHPMRPAHWGGYRLVPDRWEFWQGRRNRLHDRLCYRVATTAPAAQTPAGAAPATGWVRERLAP